MCVPVANGVIFCQQQTIVGFRDKLHTVEALKFDFHENIALATIRELSNPRIVTILPPSLLVLPDETPAEVVPEDCCESPEGVNLVFFAFTSLKRCLLGINTISRKGRLFFDNIVSAKASTRRAFGIYAGPATYSLTSTNAERNTSAWDDVLGPNWDRLVNDSVVIYKMTFSESATPVKSLNRVVKVSVDFVRGDYSFDGYRAHVVKSLEKTNLFITGISPTESA